MSSAAAHRLAILTAALFVLTACERALLEHTAVPSGDAERGHAALLHHECGVCHVIPGVPGATGSVGPSLAEYDRYTYVAGKLPNTPDALVAWLLDPPRFAPHTAMPKLPLSEAEARDMAAYLYRGRE